MRQFLKRGIVYHFVTHSVVLPLQVFAVSVTLCDSHSEEEMERGLERVVIRSCDVSLCVESVSLGMYCLTVSLVDSVLAPWRFPPLPVYKVKKIMIITKRLLKRRRGHTQKCIIQRNKCAMGQRAVKFGNNWRKRIPRRVKIGQSRRTSPLWQ